MKTRYLIVIIFFAALFLFIAPLFAAPLNCPFGRINDPYPGLCARYTDTNNNGICDNSQSANGGQINTQAAKASNVNPGPRYYLFQIALVLFLLYGFSRYLIYLSRQTKNAILNKFNAANIRYAMNVILLASFLVSFATALLNLAQIRLNWFMGLGVNFSWWHIESGLVMGIIAIIHTIERIKYFSNRKILNSKS